MKILIIRHGDPDYANDTLTEKGKREAALLAETLQGKRIDALYVSPLGRAKDTAAYIERKLGLSACEFSWLTEFNHFVDLPSGEKNHLVWDMLPQNWTQERALFDKDDWKNLPYMQAGNIGEYYGEVTAGLDALLARHGYCREGLTYRVERENRDVIALVCHFGVQCMLLSHLLNLSPVVLSHGFVALPTSVTTLYTEERRQGVASFRCCAFGDTGHLLVGGEEPSFSARFCETFHSDERHD